MKQLKFFLLNLFALKFKLYASFLWVTVLLLDDIKILNE